MEKKKALAEKSKRNSLAKTKDAVSRKTVKEKDFKFYILNIKITSRKPVTDQSYKNLFELSFSGKKTGHLFGEVYGIIRQLFGGKGSEPLYGLFCRYVKLGDLAMNIDNLEIVGFEIPKNLFPNPREANFTFYPDLHRMAIPYGSKISPNTIKRLTEEIFKKVIDKSETVEVLIEQSSDAFEKIIAAKEIKKVHIEISPSNADTNKDATYFVDEELKKMGAGLFVSDIHPNATGRLNAEGSKILQGFFGMAASNGHVIATIVNDNDKKEIVNTEKHPAVLSITAGSADEARGVLYNTLKRRFRDGRNRKKI